MSFIHLHTHSHYSIGRAVPGVADLVRRAAELQMPAIALTDNNSIAGLGELTIEAARHNIQPILGAELDILPSTHGIYQGRTHRLTLLVESEQGYRNLVGLITRAHTRPGDQPVHITFNELLRQSQGLIVLTGSPRSELYAWLREGKAAETKEYLNRLAAGVGAGNLYFEIIDYPHPRTRDMMDYIRELSHFLHIPAVVTQNVHFLDPEDMIAYCALTQHGHVLSPRWPLREDELPTRHFTTDQEMQRRFTFHTELLDETERIAERCAFSFPRRRARIPVPNFDRGQDAPSVLWDQAVRGAASRYGALTESIKERLNREYSDIRSDEIGCIDLAEYLLLLQDITTFLREMGLCRGVGRGRFISSVIAYALGIVEVDPLAYNLDYQPLRDEPSKLPLFQIEVSSEGQEKVLLYLKDRYGEGNVAMIARRVDWSRQRLFEHLSRWAGLSIVSLRKYPPERRGQGRYELEFSEEVVSETRIESDLLKANWDEEVEKVTEGAPPVPLLGDERIPRGKSMRQYRTIADIVYTLHPCPRSFEAERTQYVLSKEPLSVIVPVMRFGPGMDVVQADSDLLDRLEMPRIQFASSSMLNILETAQKGIRQEENPNFSFSNIPLTDEATFKLLGLGLTNGITALHSITAKSLLRTQRPRSISQLLRIHAGANKRHPGDGDPNPIYSLPDCVLSYWCAYLKVHYPVSFMTAMLTHSLSTYTSGDQRPSFQILLRETRKMGIEVLGPHINLSTYEFSQEGQRIRTGLMVVQGLGPRTYQEIAEVRHGLPFSALADFCHRTDPKKVPHATVANLIKAGAFDPLGPNRTKLIFDLERLLKYARSNQASGASDSQLQLFDPALFEAENKSSESYKEEDTYSLPSRREIMRYEQDAIGYSISFDLLDHYDELMRTMRAVSPFEMNGRMEGKTIYVAGFVDHIAREGTLIDEETEMVLDLEGHVVKIPPSVAPAAGRVQGTRGPVLVEGLVSRSQGECYLLAQRIYLLEEVARKAEEVALVRINMAGENSRTLKILRSVLKPYKGHTRVEVENFPALSWWNARGVEKAEIFFCPPLYQGLTRVLEESAITLFNIDGDVVKP